MKTHAVRRIQFCAGHRVHNHESKCANVHGHNYVAFFHAEADELDSVGRVIDFSVLKEKIGGWIDSNWDHTFICYNEDQVTIDAMTKLHLEIGNKSIYVMQNPTAENMAAHLLKDICPKVLKGTGVRVTKVVLWETENCNVEVSL